MKNKQFYLVAELKMAC